MRSHPVKTVFATLLTAVLWVAFGTSALASTPSAGALGASAFTLAKAEGSFRLEAAFQDGTGTVTVTANVARSEGDQVFTIADRGAHGRAQLVLLNKVAYVRADVLGLKTFLSFGPQQAAANANRWLALAPSDSTYASAVEGVTLASALEELALPPKLAYSSTATIDGRAIRAIRGSETSSGVTETTTLFLPATGPALPVRETQTSDGSTATFDLSHWGEKVHEIAPRGAITLK